MNALNRINFLNGPIFIVFKHLQFNSILTLSARPLPCRDETLECIWDEPSQRLPQKLSGYQYCGFFFSDGFRKTQVDANIEEITETGLILKLPETGYQSTRRKIRRYPCLDIRVELNQSSLVLSGKLNDFNAVGFAVDISCEPSFSFDLVDIDNPLNVLLKKGDDVLFSETCNIIRMKYDEQYKIIVLTPITSHIRRFRPKEYRSVRQTLSPQPNLIFTHPFIDKKISLPAVDISGSGMAVEEAAGHTLLLPGLVLPEVAISFSGNFNIDCRAQVLFNLPRFADNSVKCGLVFLDMDVRNQMQLSSILYQARNEHSYVGANVDLDALWEFFFDTGFIYPEKYVSIQDQRDSFKHLYSRLYGENPDIARHIIYQDKGNIYGHVSMFRYYNQTWLLHHHAAIRSSEHKAGLVVMEHILQHINEVHHIQASNMRYIACYYRPNNRFANRTFGDAARSLQDQQKASLDTFAYFHYKPELKAPGALPPGLMLVESDQEDFELLNYFYDDYSGGLMMSGLDLQPKSLAKEEIINSEYQKIGFKRSRNFISLKDAPGTLIAFLVVNISDVGLNMSDLTNCVHFFVIDQEKMKKEYFPDILNILATCYVGVEFPVLLYPSDYAEKNEIQFQKIYELGILDLRNISPYMQYIDTLVHPTGKKTLVNISKVNSPT